MIPLKRTTIGQLAVWMQDLPKESCFSGQTPSKDAAKLVYYSYEDQKLFTAMIELERGIVTWTTR